MIRYENCVTCKTWDLLQSKTEMSYGAGDGLTTSPSQPELGSSLEMK